MAELGQGSGSGYPAALDTDINLEVNSPDANKTKARAEVPNDLASAIIAIQTELGINPAGSLTDVKTFLQTQHTIAGVHNIAIDDLTDVNAPTPNDNDALTWDNATSKWIPEAVGGASQWADSGDGKYIHPAAATEYRVLDAGTDLSSYTFSASTIYILTPGTYTLTGGITLSNTKVTIAASPGAIITKSGNFDCIKITGTYCKVIDVEINGADQGSSGIFITGSYNEARGCIVYDNAGHGIGLDGQSTTCKHNIVTKNIVYSNDSIGISQNKTTDNIIANNHSYSNGLEGITIDNQADGCVCTGNRLDGNGVSGGVGAIGIDYVNNIKVTGNVITDQGTNAGIAIQNNLGVSSNSVISGNIIDNSDTDGIVFVNANNYGSQGFTITGNTCTNNGAVAGWGIRLGANGTGYTINCTVVGNMCRGNASGTIVADANCNTNNIVGNQCYGTVVVDNGTGNLVGYNTTVPSGGGGGTGGWTDDGTVVRLTTATDDVAIGTTSTSYKLRVHETSGSVVSQISTDDTENAILFFDTDSDGTPRQGVIGIDHSDSVLRLNYGTSFNGVNNGLAIDSVGDIGFSGKVNFPTMTNSSPANGDIWYGNGDFWGYKVGVATSLTGGGVATAHVSNSPPSPTEAGQIWIDTT